MYVYSTPVHGMHSNYLNYQYGHMPAHSVQQNQGYQMHVNNNIGNPNLFVGGNSNESKHSVG